MVDINEDVEMPIIQSEEDSDFSDNSSSSSLSDSSDSDSDDEVEAADYDTLYKLYQMSQTKPVMGAPALMTPTTPIINHSPPYQRPSFQPSLQTPPPPPPQPLQLPSTNTQQAKIIIKEGPASTPHPCVIRLPLITKQPKSTLPVNSKLTTPVRKLSPIGELPLITFLCQNIVDTQQTESDYLNCMELLISLDNERRRLQFLKNKEKTSQKIIEQLYGDICIRLHQVLVEYNPLLSSFGNTAVYHEVLSHSNNILMQNA